MYTTALVDSHIEVEKPYYLLTLHHPEVALQSKPGQFVMVTPHPVNQNNSSFYLKRPISIFGVDKEKGNILLYYQVLGRGTEYITHLQAGDSIHIIAPQGRGFKTNIENQKVLLIGAGVGISPLKYLYDIIKEKNEVHCLFSGRDAAALKYTKYFGKLDHVYYACDTGAIGTKGNAIQLAEQIIKQIEPFTMIYCCGPPVVLKAIVNMAQKIDIPTQVSLEARMGCALRACQACTIVTTMGPQKVCGFGPVFDAQNLILEEL